MVALDLAHIVERLLGYERTHRLGNATKADEEKLFPH
jgi:hypothetical protein